MRIMVLLSVVLVASECVAQSRGSLEAVLADPSKVYEAGENVFVEVVLHVEAEKVNTVNFCVEREKSIAGGSFEFSPDVHRQWNGCKLLSSRDGGILENHLGMGTGLCDPGSVLRVVGGRIELGHVVLRVTADEETLTTAEVRIGVCNAWPQHDAFCYVGDTVTNPVVVAVESAAPVTVTILRPPFIRGDANGDDQVDIADAIFIIQELFGTQNRGWPCLNAADANEDDSLNISDGIYLINFLFLGTAPPPWPFPEPGYDPDPTRPEVSGCETLS